MLLADLKAIFDGKLREARDPANGETMELAKDLSGVLFTEEVLSVLGAMEERPWSEYGAGKYRAGKPITSHQLSALLKPLGVRPNSVRRGGKTGKGYRLEDLEDAFARYLLAASG
jgi:hypothetical protein